MKNEKEMFEEFKKKIKDCPGMDISSKEFGEMYRPDKRLEIIS